VKRQTPALQFLTAGENLASHPLQIAHTGLMKSGGHRVNILQMFGIQVDVILLTNLLEIDEPSGLKLRAWSKLDHECL